MSRKVRCEDIVDAKIYKRAYSKFWQYKLRLNDGRIVRKTTRIKYEHDPKMTKAKNLVKTLWKVDVDVATCPYDMEKVYWDFWKIVSGGYTPKKISLKEGIEIYLNSFETRIVAPTTVRLYKDALSKFANFIGDDTAIEDIKPCDAESFKTYLLKNFSRETSKCAFNNVKSFLRFLHTNSYIKENLIQGVKGIESDKHQLNKNRKTYGQQEFERIIEATKGTYWEAMVYIARYTGQRLMDIFNLTWEQIDLTGNGKIEFHIQKTKNRGRAILIQSFIFTPLREYLKTTKTLPDRHGRLFKFNKTEAVLSREFHNILLKLGIVTQKPKPEGKRRRISNLVFHCFRKTLSKDMINRGYDSSFRGAFLGQTKEVNESNYTPPPSEAEMQSKLQQMDSELYQYI